MRLGAVGRAWNLLRLFDSGFTRAARLFFLAALFALGLCTLKPSNVSTFHRSADESVPGVIVEIVTALPNDCAIVASEATARLRKTGAWTRILNILYAEREVAPLNLAGPKHRHDLAVWQRPGAHAISIYDESILNGTLELDTESHDPAEIAHCFAERQNLIIFEAQFLK